MARQVVYAAWAGLLISAPQASFATTIVLTNSYSIPFSFSFGETLSNPLNTPLNYNVHQAFTGFLPGFNILDPRLGGATATPVRQSISSNLNATATSTTFVMENSGCSVFFPCPFGSVDQTAKLTVSNLASGISVSGSGFRSADLATLPPLQRRTLSQSLQGQSSTGSVDQNVTPSGNYTFNLDLSLQAPAIQSRRFDSISGTVAGTLTGVMQTSVETSSKPTPPPSVPQTVPDPVAAPLAGQIAISSQPTFSLTGPINGTTFGLIGINQLPVSSRLGTLSSNAVTINSNLTYSATVPEVSNLGPIYTQGFDVAFRTALNYGTPDIVNTYSAPSICPGQNGCSGATFSPYTLFSPGGSSSVASPTLTGGPISVRVNATMSPEQASAFGNWALQGSAAINQIYQPKTTAEYVRDAIAVSGSDVSRANSGYADIILLRDTSAATASKNLALRDAEYFLRGYAGGASNLGEPVDFSSLDAAFNDTANRFGPIATAIYNGKKVVDTALGRNTAGPTGLPNTPAGGFDANVNGFTSGLLGVPLDKAVDTLHLPASTKPSTTSDAPTLPTINILGVQSELSVFNLNLLDANTLNFLDPKQAAVLAFGVDGNRFAGFEYLNGPDSLTLHVLGQDFTILSGRLFNFTSLDQMGVTGFFLSGLADFAPSGLDFVSGLSFISPGKALVSILGGANPFAATVEVPEPATLSILMTLLSFLVSGAWMRVRTLVFATRFKQAFGIQT